MAAIKAVFGSALGIVLALVLIIGIGAALTYGYFTFIQPIAINQGAQNIRHSVNYVTAHNDQMRAAIVEYTGTPESDTAHRSALVLQVRSLANELSPDEVAPDVQQFLATH